MERMVAGSVAADRDWPPIHHVSGAQRRGLNQHDENLVLAQAGTRGWRHDAVNIDGGAAAARDERPWTWECSTICLMPIVACGTEAAPAAGMRTEASMIGRRRTGLSAPPPMERRQVTKPSSRRRRCARSFRKTRCAGPS